MTAQTELLGRFAARAAETQMTCAAVEGYAAVPAAVATCLREADIEPAVLTVDLPQVSASGWAAAGLEISAPPVARDGGIFVSACYAAVADNGAIVVRTGAGHAIANEFLAATHIAVLPAVRLVAGLRDLWQLWCTEFPSPPQLPREFCLVTGPSRTADLGLPAKLGAHGPARVHVVVVV